MSKHKYTLMVISNGGRSRVSHTERSRRPLPSQRRKPTKRRPYLAVIPGICRVCGCTDSFACPGAAAWADDGETLCSRCAEKG